MDSVPAAIGAAASSMGVMTTRRILPDLLPYFSLIIELRPRFIVLRDSDPRQLWSGLATDGCLQEPDRAITVAAQNDQEEIAKDGQEWDASSTTRATESGCCSRLLPGLPSWWPRWRWGSGSPRRFSAWSTVCSCGPCRTRNRGGWWHCGAK